MYGELWRHVWVCVWYDIAREYYKGQAIHAYITETHDIFMDGC